MTFLLISSLTFVALAGGEQCDALFREVKPATRVVIEIADQKIPGFLDNENEAFRIPVVNIHAGHQFLQLKDLEPLAIADGARVFVFARGADGRRRSLDVPIWIRERLREYLRQGGPPTTPFDCNCFAHWMNGVAFEFGQFKRRSWNLEMALSEDAVQPGDTVLLGYSYEEVKHVAVALGDGLFISKFGVDGPVLITNFATLQLAYGGFLFARATPRDPSEIAPKANADQTPVP